MRGVKTAVQTGEVFGKLTVLSFSGKYGSHRLWKCRCSCGTEKVIRQSNLVSKQTMSCGCLRKEHHARKHGFGGVLRSPEYRAWQCMRSRCLNPKDKAYKNYGGRGIGVCERWSSFESFLADMGLRASKDHSLDRIDVQGNYEPNNCRWATRSEQMKNCRPKKAIESFSNEELLNELQRRIISGSITSA